MAIDDIRLGRFVDIDARSIEENIDYAKGLNVVLVGANGSGKNTRILSPNLLRSEGISIFVYDTKAELAAISAPYQGQVARKVVINPFGVLTDRHGFEDLRSDGLNPLIGINPGDPSFNVKASLLAEAMMPVGGKDPHWDESARALGALCIMHEVIEARRYDRAPSMARVRELICLPSEGPNPANDYEGQGIPRLARQWAQSAIPGMRNKAGQFTDWTRETQGIRSTAMRHTEFLDDPEIADDLERGNFDLAEMKRRPCTVYLILPPEMMARHARWVRLLLTAAMQAVLRAPEPGEPRVLFMLDEFAAVAKGGLSIIENNWALVRGYSIQILLVFQDLTQIKDIYGDRWETFLANAGAAVFFAPNDMTTAKWLSERAGDTTEITMSYSSTDKPNEGHDSHGNGISYHQTKVPLISPHRLFGLGEGFAITLLAGESNVVATFAPAYYNVTLFKQRARVNPYYHAVPRRAALPSGGSPSFGNRMGQGNMTVSVSLGKARL